MGFNEPKFSFISHHSQDKNAILDNTFTSISSLTQDLTINLPSSFEPVTFVKSDRFLTPETIGEHILTNDLDNNNSLDTRNFTNSKNLINSGELNRTFTTEMTDDFILALPGIQIIDELNSQKPLFVTQLDSSLVTNASDNLSDLELANNPEIEINFDNEAM